LYAGAGGGGGGATAGGASAGRAGIAIVAYRIG
jgi:hypothetical protein